MSEKLALDLATEESCTGGWVIKSSGKTVGFNISGSYNISASGKGENKQEAVENLIENLEDAVSRCEDTIEKIRYF